MSLKNRAGLVKIIDAMDSVEKCLLCAICLEIPSEPVETRCGHLFCRLCIKKVLSHPSQSCPICKTNLTQRSFSASHRMGLCIRQLSKLRDAIRDDTSLDITKCLKMNYKTAATLPSVSSSSPRSLHDVKNHLPLSESNGNIEKDHQNVTNDSANVRTSQENRFHTNVTADKNANVVNEEAPRSKRKRSTNPSKNVVIFKKRGHLFKGRRKSVAFIYCGPINQPGSKFHDGTGSTGISARHWSLLGPNNEVCSINKLHAESNVPVNASISMLERAENITENSKQIVSRTICTPRCPDLHTADKNDEKSNPEFQGPSVDGKSRLVPVQSTEQISPVDWETWESSTVAKKRKRSESPNDNRTNDSVKRQNKESEYCESICDDNSECSWQSYHGNRTVSSNKTICRREVSVSSEREIPIVCPDKIDLPAEESFDRSNATLPTEVRKLSSNRDPVGYEARSPSELRTVAAARADESRVFDEIGKINLSQDSMMNITAEEMMFKEFEENLFRPEPSKNDKRPSSRDGKQREDNEMVIDGHEENDPKSAAVVNNVLTAEPVDQIVSISNTALKKHGKSQSMTGENSNRVKTPPAISRDENVETVRPDAVIPQNYERTESAKPPLPKITTAKNVDKTNTHDQTETRIVSLHRTSRKSSEQQGQTNKSRTNVDRQTEINTNCLIPKTEDDTNAGSLVLKASQSDQGCVLCTGLTVKQSEVVGNFASLFNMRRTKKFSDEVTHVIVKTNEVNNGAYKTLKSLQAIAYRKWVLSFDWIVDCLTEQKLLNEETYEVVDNTTSIPGPKKARLGANGPFEGFVFMCIEPFQNVSVADYEDLLHHMGGTVVRSLNELAAHSSALKIIVVQAEAHQGEIMEWHKETRAVPVAEEWIFECVSQYRLVTLLPFLHELAPQSVRDLGFPEQLLQDE